MIRAHSIFTFLAAVLSYLCKEVLYFRRSRESPVGVIRGGMSASDGDHTPHSKYRVSSSAVAVFLRKTTPGWCRSKWKRWYCFIPSRQRNWEEGNPAQSQEGTMVVSCVPTSGTDYITHSPTTRAKSSNDLTSVRRNFLLMRPKQASTKNLVPRQAIHQS